MAVEGPGTELIRLVAVNLEWRVGTKQATAPSGGSRLLNTAFSRNSSIVKTCVFSYQQALVLLHIRLHQYVVV